MTEKVVVNALEIPDIGSFLLVSPEILGTEEESFRRMFDNDEITITAPDCSKIYKEIKVENVWTETSEKPLTFKWSRNGIAVLYKGFWEDEEERLGEKESFLELFNS